MKKVLLVFITTIVCTGLTYADGCLPGDPCYEKPMRKAAPAMRKQPMKKAPAAAPVMMEEESHHNRFYTTIGAGWAFKEKDEAILGHQAYELKIGRYRFADRLSAEVGFALLPDVRARKFPSTGRFALPEDTEGVRFSADLLIHLNEEASDIDPYLTVGGGVNTFDDNITEDGDNSEGYAAIGAGAFMDIDSCWFVKPDYRLAMVGSDTEVNHQAMVALGYRWDM